MDRRGAEWNGAFDKELLKDNGGWQRLVNRIYLYFSQYNYEVSDIAIFSIYLLSVHFLQVRHCQILIYLYTILLYNQLTTLLQF